MNTLILAAIRCSLMLTAVTASLFSVRAVQGYTLTLEQDGSNVVAIGSGPINLTGLTFAFSSSATGVGVNPQFGIIATGATGVVNEDFYTGYTGPTSFGSGGITYANTGSGPDVAIQGVLGGYLILPQGYVSGNVLSDSMTFNNQTFATLGVTPGTYEWTWGNGRNTNFTLVIPSVPDGGSTVALLGFALAALGILRRKLRC